MLKLSIIGILVLMTICSIEDIKERKIKVLYCILFSVPLIMMNYIFGELEIFNAVTGMIPGIIIFGISILTREAIGKGDALLLILTGAISGLEFISLTIILSMFITVIIGGMILFFSKRMINKNASIPYIPILEFSYIIVLLKI